MKIVSVVYTNGQILVFSDSGRVWEFKYVKAIGTTYYQAEYSLLHKGLQLESLKELQ